MKRLTVVVPDAEMESHRGLGNTMPCTLVLEVDAELLAALARPPSHRAALIAEAEARRAG